MKTRKKLLCGLLCALLCAACIPAQGAGADGAAETGERLEGDMLSEAVIASYATPQERLAAMQAVAEDDKAVLYYDVQTAQVALLDKASGQAFFSSPYNTAASDAPEQTKQRMASPLRIVYCDTSTVAHEMNAFADAAASGQITSYRLENGVSAQLVLGREAHQQLLPRAVPAETFETVILASSTPQAQKRLKRQYRRLDIADYSEEEQAEFLKLYPGLVDGPAYLLNKDASDTVRKELEGYIQKTAYTYEQLAADEKAVLGEVGQEETAQAYFKITVECRLEDGALTVTVPCDGIEYDREKFRLQQIVLLEYFAALTGEVDGFLLIPDGSGALLSPKGTGINDGGAITGRFYGADAARIFDRADSLREAFRMPVYGVAEGSAAVFGIVERGAESAELTAVTQEKESRYSKAYTTLNYSDAETYTYTERNGAGTQRSNWSKMSDRHFTGDYRLRFLLLSGEKAGVSGMAQSYRDYLISTGALSDENDSAADLPLFLGTLGAARVEARFLFIPYQKSVAMTDFAQTQEMAAELMAGGVGNLSVRCIGWANGGVEHGAFSRLNVERSLGGARGFTDMVAALAEKGVTVYPEIALSSVTEDRWFDGFSLKRDTARRLNGTYALTYAIGLGSNVEDGTRSRLVVKPTAMSSFWDRLLGSRVLSGAGLAPASLGSELHSDFDTGSGVSRQESADLYTAMLKKGSEAHAILVDGGNTYTYPYADVLMDVPSSSSGYLQASSSVPFMQMVLFGSKVYTGRAINLSADPTYSFLKAIENMEGLAFTVAGKNSETLLETDYRYTCFSVDYGDWKERILTMYAAANAIYREVADARMVSHSYIADNVAAVTYSNGKRVVVNYTDRPVTVDGTAVAAKSAAVIG